MLSTVRASALIVAVAAMLEPALSDPPSVSARLWQDPPPSAQRDLRWGPGAADRAPRPPFRFVEERSTGTQPKVVVTDAAGTTWDVKFGPEAHAEVAANRLVWALGYFVEEVYFVPTGMIAGAVDLDRADKAIGPGGTFSDARFRRRDDRFKRMDERWRFDANPFLGSRELSGLKILMTLIGNWDIEGDRNNAILEVTGSSTQKGPERRYIVADLGATFGRMGARMSNHSKWDLAGYQGEGFIDKVGSDSVELDFDGLESNMQVVPLAHARWFASLTATLTEAQVRQAFDAAGAKPDEAAAFTAVVMKRLAALQRAVGTTGVPTPSQ